MLQAFFFLDRVAKEEGNVGSRVRDKTSSERVRLDWRLNHMRHAFKPLGAPTVKTLK